MNTIKRDFNIEEFLDKISMFPAWVKSPDDLMRFCRFIQYRMYQWKGSLDFLIDHFQMPKSLLDSLQEVQMSYDDAYSSDKCSLVPFAEMQKDHQENSIKCKKMWESAGIKESNIKQD